MVSSGRHAEARVTNRVIKDFGVTSHPLGEFLLGKVLSIRKDREVGVIGTERLDEEGSKRLGGGDLHRNLEVSRVHFQDRALLTLRQSLRPQMSSLRS